MALAGYTRQQRIDIDNRGNVNNMAGCQIKVALNTTNFNFATAKPDGSDVRFTLSDGDTLLPHYRESYDSVTQAAVFWVKLTAAIPAAAQSHIFVWCGNPAAADASTLTTREYPVTGSDCIAVFSGTNAYPGVLDSYPAEGSIKVHFTTTGAYQNKRVFCKFNTASYNDFIDCYIDATSNVVLRISRAGTVTVLRDPVALTAGKEHCVVFSWNTFSGAGTFRGWKILYVNQRIAAKTGLVQMPNSGSAAPFAYGQLVTHDPADTAGSGFPGVVSDGAVYNTQKQLQHVRALAERRKFHYLDEESKWVKKAAPTYRYAPGEAGMVYEPTIIYDPVEEKYRMWHSTSLTNSFVGYAESTDLQTWTNRQVVIGQGFGNEPAYAFRVQVVKYPGDPLFYAYYQNSTVEGGVIRVATSTNGIVWTGNQTALAVDTSKTSGYHSPGLLKVGGTYYMWMDCETDEAYRYFTGLATAASPLGPFTFQRVCYDFTMPPEAKLSLDGTRLLGRPQGNPQPIMVDGRIHIWAHGIAAETPDPPTGDLVLPSEGARLITDDFGQTYSRPYPHHTLRIDQPEEFDQLSDLCVFSAADGSTWCAAACNDNYTFNPSEFIAQLLWYRYPGTVTQLTQDLRVTVQANPATRLISLTPGKFLIQNGKLLSTTT